VQPDEILVAPTTSSSWTIVFNIISGVVTDSGGSLGHPAIMAREFGIPAVVNSFEATRKIKTGDRIRVDGNQGFVQILS
jgi:pyruvate,water dikinase